MRPSTVESNLIIFADGLNAINAPESQVVNCAQNINSLPACFQSKTVSASISHSSNMNPTAVKYL